MNKTILQIPLNKQLKDEAEKIASKHGFSSLQEIIRVFLTQLALNRIEVTIQRPSILSSKNEKRYLKMTDDFKSGSNHFSAKDINDFISKLNAD